MWSLPEQMSLRRTCGDFAFEVNLSSQDLFSRFEGDVPTYHVIKQQAKRPDSGWVTIVVKKPEPLWWTVHHCTWRKGASGILYCQHKTERLRFGVKVRVMVNQTCTAFLCECAEWLCCLLARAAGHKSGSWCFWKILLEQNKDAAHLSSPKTGLMQDLTCVR